MLVNAPVGIARFCDIDGKSYVVNANGQIDAPVAALERFYGAGFTAAQVPQAPAFTASFTPDCSLGSVITMTLTAALTVNKPINAQKGMRLTFIMIQGGTGGYTTTWNAIFKKTWSETGNTTGKQSVIEFIFDGTSWNYVAAQVAYA